MRSKFWSILGLTAALALLGGAGSTAWAGVFSSFATSNAPPSTNMVPGQTYTVTVTAQTGSAIPSIIYNQIALSPNLGNQFQIVGGTCNTTTQYVNNATCTVDIKFFGTAPSSFTADLMMQCIGLAAVGGYSITCGTGTVGVSARMARVLGTGIAAAVDALGAGGLTLLAALLFVMTSVITLKRRA